MTTTVANIRDLPDDWWLDLSYVYIARSNGIHAESPFANPFPLAYFNQDRVACVERYIDWFESRPKLVEAAMRILKGRTLVCWCKPKLCHGDYLAARVDGRAFSFGRFLF